MDQHLIAQEISPFCRVSIVIPVRNEALSIGDTLHSFVNQKNIGRTQFEVIILANNCTDNSVKIIKKFQKQHPLLNLHLAEISLSPENANIGFVRRLLMNEAHRRLKCNRFGGGVMMTTDGDTIVAADWIATNLREIEKGADAVGGRILMTESELAKMDAGSRLIHLRDEKYRLLIAEIENLLDPVQFDPAPRHHQHFNGSFACTTSIFAKAGGIPPVKFLEDIAFYDSLQRIDAKYRHSPQVQVFTSARHSGRSEVGLSFQLNEWKNLNASGGKFMVESAESIVERLKLKRNLRKTRTNFVFARKIDLQEIKAISERFFVATDFVVEELKKSTTFGFFYENLLAEQSNNNLWSEKFPIVSLESALVALPDKIAQFSNVSRSFSQTSMR